MTHKFIDDVPEFFVQSNQALQQMKPIRLCTSLVSMPGQERDPSAMHYNMSFMKPGLNSQSLEWPLLALS